MVYLPKDTPRDEAWIAFNQLIGNVTRRGGETDQQLLDAIAERGFNAAKMLAATRAQLPRDLGDALYKRHRRAVRAHKPLGGRGV